MLLESTFQSSNVNDLPCQTHIFNNPVKISVLFLPFFQDYSSSKPIQLSSGTDCPLCSSTLNNKLDSLSSLSLRPGVSIMEQLPMTSEQPGQIHREKRVLDLFKCANLPATQSEGEHLGN